MEASSGGNFRVAEGSGNIVAMSYERLDQLISKTGEGESFYRRLLVNCRRLVVKVGSSSLAHHDGSLNQTRMKALVGALADQSRLGRDVILVTSGAVAAGLGRLGWKRKPRNMPEKQAVAAVGQGILMQSYEALFAEHGLTVGQVLLTREDLADRRRYLNARHTMLTLLRYGVVPVVNENDTIAVEEIRLGDNDTLAALTAGLVDADLVVLLTDTEGLYTADPRLDLTAEVISLVIEITPELQNSAGKGGGVLGTGGMASKLAAAAVCTGAGIPLVIASGTCPDLIIADILAGETRGTLFVPQESFLQGKKRWIAFGPAVQGHIVVDDGAAKAILSGGKSLLPRGVVAAAGSFEAGNILAVVNLRGEEIARGMVNYGNREVELLKGRHSTEIASVLGYKDYDEVIHRDNMAVRQGKQGTKKGR